jgi:hypothetical protein
MHAGPSCGPRYRDSGTIKPSLPGSAVPTVLMALTMLTQIAPLSGLRLQAMNAAKGCTGTRMIRVSTSAENTVSILKCCPQ